MMKVTINLPLLVQKRLERNYSTSDVAFALGYKTPTGYWLIEHGKRKVSVAILYKLAKLYNCTMEEFIVES